MKIIVSLLVALMFSFSASAQVTLPIEIFGENSVESISVNVDDPTDVDRLYIRAHGLTFEGKGSVKVNNQAWIDLSEATSTYIGIEGTYRGFGLGPFHTIRITVPLNEGVVVTGSNTIQFRMNTDDNISQGWRVIAVELWYAATEEDAITTTRSFDDPDTWTPISEVTQDLIDGATLWSSAALTDPAVGGAIDAHCADCHTSGAEDLVYFNYSDESIINRAEFHGLSTTDSEKIASWIRSLSLPNPGRPWSPVYQPGPGIDAGGKENWAAGAGLDAILEDDISMLPELFPGGVINDNGPSDTKGYINVREQETSIIFPDWNGWLPRTHPMDLWPSFTSSFAWDDYVNSIPTLIALGPGVYLQSGRIQREFETWNNVDVSDFREETAPDPGWSNVEWARANLDLMQWQLVKSWEFIRQNELEDVCPTLYPDQDGKTYGEELCWPSGQSRSVFDVAPHISGVGGQENSYSGLEHAKYMTHTWYELQMILNAGNRDPLSLKPMDWKYQHGHTTDISGYFGTGSWVRLSRSFMKSMQQMDNDDGIGTRGFYMRHAIPYWWGRSLLREEPDGGYNPIIWAGSTEEQRLLMATVLTRQFVERLYEFDINDWPREDDEGVDEHAALEALSYEPILDSDYDWDDRFNYAEQLYNMPHLLLNKGVSVTLVDSLARWGELAWPTADWEQYFFASTSRGDVSGNGSITSLDASMILQHLSGIITLTGEALINADVTYNDAVSALDASYILQYVAEIITCFPQDPACP